MANYTPRSWNTGDQFTPAQASAMSAELEEQEVKDAEQDGRLNALEAGGSGAWADITGKPAVIAAGSTQAAARTAIGAGTASTKADVGLGSVDNTADTAKPVSTAQAAADAAVLAASQPVNPNLTAIAAGTTTAFGRGVLSFTDATAARAGIGAATQKDVYRAIIAGGAPRPVHPTPPTIAHSTTATAGLRVYGYDTRGVNYTVIGANPYVSGGDRLANNSEGQQNNLNPWEWETLATGSVFEFKWRATPTPDCWMQVFVDDQPVAADIFQPSGVTLTTGGVYFTKLTFTDATPRKIRIRSRYMALYEIRCSMVGDCLATRPTKPVLAVVGGSFSGSTSFYNELQAWPWPVADALGMSLAQCAIGGTGYVAAGSASIYGSATRLAALYACNPDLIIVEGSGNDDGLGGIQANATAMFAAIATNLPGVPVVCVGAMPRNDVQTIATSRADNLAAVKAAAVAAPNVGGAFFDPCGTVNPQPAFAPSTVYGVGNRVSYLGAIYRCITAHTSAASGGPDSNKFVQLTWTTGTGKSGATTGDGSRDVLLASDGTHPTVLGQKSFALNMIREMRTRLLA